MLTRIDVASFGRVQPYKAYLPASARRMQAYRETASFRASALHPSQPSACRQGGDRDTVTDVRRAGAIIAYGTVRHIWKRVPLPVNGSICLPWELR
jgi:hypothetical protein